MLCICIAFLHRKLQSPCFR